MTSLHSKQCLTCAYPLDRDQDVLSVLARVREMMMNVGFGVDRVLIEDGQTKGQMCITLEIRSASSPKRGRNWDNFAERTAKRACRLCPSSFGSSNSLCNANACSHKGEEVSKPCPSSPERLHYHHKRYHCRDSFHSKSNSGNPESAPNVVLETGSAIARGAALPPPISETPESDPGEPRKTPEPCVETERLGKTGFRTEKENIAMIPYFSKTTDRTRRDDLQMSELVCKPCSLKFEDELELRKHQLVDHKDDKIVARTREGRFLCVMHSCQQSFVRRHVMERHFKTVHLMVREFPCSKCEKSFADNSTREAHQSAVHEKRKPWVCDQCSSCFTQSSSLGKHRRRFHREAEIISNQKQ